MKQKKVTLAQARLLQEISGHGGIYYQWGSTARSLPGWRRMGRTRDISSMVNALVDAGYLIAIGSHKPGQDDKVKVTQEGKEFLKSLES